MTKYDEMKEEILSTMADRVDRAYTTTQLTSILGMKKDYQLEVQALLNSLYAEGKVVKVGKKYSFADDSGQLSIEKTFLTGKFDATSLARNMSFAFVLTEDDNDVYVSSEDTLNAYHGDMVEVEVTKYRQGKRYGIVRKIVSRAKDKFIGTLERVRGKTYFRSDSLKIHTLFEVLDNGQSTIAAMSNVNGQLSALKVQVEIINWGLRQKSKLPLCKVTEILGEAGNPEVEVLSVIREFDLPMEFPEAVLDEANSFTDEITPDQIKRRRDLRDLYTITIDPISAKDFDDAISLIEADNGDLHLYVHIADVAHFVKVGSALFTEAVQRGNSYYFPKKVIPMLPECLSNKLCSLRPDEDKYTITVLTIFTPFGKIKHQEVFESIIRSDIRLAYEEVDEYFSSDNGQLTIDTDSEKSDYSTKNSKSQKSGILSQNKSTDPAMSFVNRQLSMALSIMRKLSQHLSLNRYQRGYLKFDLPEVEYIYDDEGYIKDIVRTKETESHILIENFMLIANEYVAKVLSKKTKTTMYRIHEEPDETDLQKIKDMLKAHKIHFVNDENLNKTWQNILDCLPDERYHRVFDRLVLRSMKKAKYSVNHIPHFGLGLADYTHFTSPIRRLCDLVVHTQLKAILENDNEQLTIEEVFKYAGVATEREQIADDAERMMEQKVIASFMTKHIGKTYKAIITNLNPTTIFIELDDIPVRGVIKLKHLTDDYYEFDPRTYQTRGKRKAKIYKLCDEIEATLVNVSDDIYFSTRNGCHCEPSGVAIQSPPHRSDVGRGVVSRNDDHRTKRHPPKSQKYRRRRKR